MDDEELILFTVVLGVVGSAAAWANMYSADEKTPRNTGRKGRELIDEMLQQENHERIRDFLRMSKAVFLALCLVLSRHGVRATENMSVEEQVAIFVWICGGNYGTRAAMEMFQRSGDTISTYVRDRSNTNAAAGVRCVCARVCVRVHVLCARP